jgi:hypothetical protein
MRFIEFADPKAYTLPRDDASDFVRQLRRSRPERPLVILHHRCGATDDSR